MDLKRTRVSTTINSLPDDIICHILSFLLTEESVRTRVLSTRWKNLFCLVPVLDFDLDFTTNSIPNSTSSCLIGTTSTHTSSDPSDRVNKFLDFVDWVFDSYNAHPVNKFHLKSKKQFQDASQLHSWISKLICLGVRKFIVYMYFQVPQTFPHGIFNCKTLTCLTIFGNFVLDVPDGACLPCVDNISLFSVSFVDGDSAKRLFRCCPVLEHLSLRLCRTEDIQVVDISVPTLKSAAFVQNQIDNYLFVLNTPNLEWVEYVGDIPYTIFNQGFKTLTEAFIEFPVNFYDFHNMFNPLEKLFSVVCHVRVLHITTSTLEALRRWGRSLPIFRNLTRLELKVNSSFDSGFILHLLSVMPNLEVFVVDNGKFVNQHSHLFPENVPECVSLRLKEVKFKRFFMMEYEFKLVKYFLKNAKVLDTLKIVSMDKWKNQLEMSTELLTYTRYSRTCKIVLTFT